MAIQLFKKNRGLVATVLVWAVLAVVFIVFPSNAQYYGAPTAQTNQNPTIYQNSAMVSGQVNPNGYGATYWFEYGTTLSFGQQTASQSAGGGYSSTYVTANIQNLLSNSTYYFRLDAQNQYGTAYGNTITFTTGNNYYGPSTGPSVDTNAATDIRNTSAVLHAYVNTSYVGATAWFEYGTDSNNLWQSTNSTYINQSNYYQTSNNSPFYSATISNLNPGTSYSFRAVVSSGNGTSRGQTLGFMTLGGNPNYYYNYNNTPTNYYGYTYPYNNNNNSYPYNYNYNNQNYSYTYPQNYTPTYYDQNQNYYGYNYGVNSAAYSQPQ